MNKVSLGKIVFGSSKKFVFIGGPCVIESEKSALRHAKALCAIAKSLQLSFVFKASYDKANRTSLDAYRGPGIKEGLRILQLVKDECGVPVVSDVHSVADIEQASRVLDIIQIPAFLCRQTDLVVAAARTGKIVNVKKGQFMSPAEVGNIINKVHAQGNKKLLITERGFSFGYNNLVSDFRAIPIVRGLGVPVVFDATHSVQMPGGQGSSSGGKREFIPTLAQCAIAAGADALFCEVHENPAKAKCDGANSLSLKDVKTLLSRLQKIKAIVG